MKLSRRKTIDKGFLAVVLAFIVLAGVCSKFFFQLMLIQGDSMLPAYHHLQLVVLDKREKVYLPGDAVAFRCSGLSSVLVKRVAAGPGDEAVILEGTLFVNGRKSEVFPGDNIFAWAGSLEKPIALADGQYLVIGDNIPESRDSRYPEVGIVSEGDIIGKIL